jgi:hypothetical protein
VQFVHFHDSSICLADGAIEVEIKKIVSTHLIKWLASVSFDCL